MTKRYYLIIVYWDGQCSSPYKVLRVEENYKKAYKQAIYLRVTCKMTNSDIAIVVMGGWGQDHGMTGNYFFNGEGILYDHYTKKEFLNAEEKYVNERKRKKYDKRNSTN